jgi:tetratricopeptide (TPR) repeat protein
VKIHRTAPVLALAVVVTSPASAALHRDGDDAADFDAIRRERPRAAQLVERGESLGASGSLEAADVLFREAEAESPWAALPWRRDCEALTALGRRREAVDACTRAVMNRHANVNLRALVRALVSGPDAPTPDDVLLALTMTSSLRESGLTATPVAMACSIAESLGDAPMLQRCSDELEQLAPDDRDAIRARALLRSRCPPARLWLGWGSILGAIALTVGHALRERIRRLRGCRIAAVGVATLCALPRIANGDPGPADDALGHWHISDEHPEDGIPSEEARNAEPLEFGYWLQDLTLKAERARERGDHSAAARFDSALALAVPDQAIAFGRLCEDYEALGDIERAIQNCGSALLRDGTTLRDYTRFVDVVASRTGPLTPDETAALTRVVAHLRADPAAASAIDDVECKVGVRTSDIALLGECTRALSARDAGSAKILGYEWALAILEGRLGDAEALISRARASGMPVAEMVQTTAAATASRTRERWHLVVSLAGLGVLLTSALYAVWLLRRRAPAQSSAKPKGPAAPPSLDGAASS